MITGVEEIDEKLRNIEGGIILLRTTGDMGLEVVLQCLEGNLGKIGRSVYIFASPQIKDRLQKHPEVERFWILGEDFEPHELFKITHIMRNLPEGSLVVFLLLNVLALHHPTDRLQSLFLSLSNIATERKLVVIVVVDVRMFSDRVLSSFEELSTVVIEFVERVAGFKVTRGMRVKKSPRGPTGFYRIEMRDGRLRISEPLG